jgi:hypothetical protein
MRFLLAAAVVLCFAASAQAMPLAVGQFINNVGSDSMQVVHLLADTGPVNVTLPDGLTKLVVEEKAWNGDPHNPYGATNDSLSISMHVLSISGKSFFTYISPIGGDLATDVGIGSQSGNTVWSALRNPSNINFIAYQNNMSPGYNVTYVIHTNSSRRLGAALLDFGDSKSAQEIQGFSPSPEPSSLMLMVGIALPLAGWTFARRKRHALSSSAP